MRAILTLAEALLTTSLVLLSIPQAPATFAALPRPPTPAPVPLLPLGAAHPAEGCLVTAQPVDSARQPVGQELEFYYRFGALFAGNAAAHSRLPNLPSADPSALARLMPLIT